jgi:hypothetical protein
MFACIGRGQYRRLVCGCQRKALSKPPYPNKAGTAAASSKIVLHLVALFICPIMKWGMINAGVLDAVVLLYRVPSCRWGSVQDSGAPLLALAGEVRANAYSFTTIGL